MSLRYLNVLYIRTLGHSEYCSSIMLSINTGQSIVSMLDQYFGKLLLSANDHTTHNNKILKSAKWYPQILNHVLSASLTVSTFATHILGEPHQYWSVVKKVLIHINVIAFYRSFKSSEMK